MLGIIALSLAACGQTIGSESSEQGLSTPVLKRNQVIVAPNGALQTYSGCHLLEGMKLVVDQNPESDEIGVWFRVLEDITIPNAAMQSLFCKKDQKVLVPFPSDKSENGGPSDPRTWGVMAQRQAQLKQDFFKAVRLVIQGEGINVMPGTTGLSSVPLFRGTGQDRNKVIPISAGWDRGLISYSDAKDLSMKVNSCELQKDDQWVVLGWMKDFKYLGKPIEVRSYKRSGKANVNEDRCPDKALMFAVLAEPGKVSYHNLPVDLILESIIENYRIK